MAVKQRRVERVVIDYDSYRVCDYCGAEAPTSFRLELPTGWALFHVKVNEGTTLQSEACSDCVEKMNIIREIKC